MIVWVEDRKFSGVYNAENLPQWNLHGQLKINWNLWIETRPVYCDRGRYLAKTDAPLDAQEGFPRYYFDLEIAKRELQAWIDARKELR